MQYSSMLILHTTLLFIFWCKPQGTCSAGTLGSERVLSHLLLTKIAAYMEKTASSRSGHRWVHGIKEVVPVILNSVSSAFLSLLSETCRAGWIFTSPCSSGLSKRTPNVLHVVHLMPYLFGGWGWLKAIFPFPFERAAGKAWPLYFCGEAVGQYLLAKVGVMFYLGV